MNPILKSNHHPQKAAREADDSQILNNSSHFMSVSLSFIFSHRQIEICKCLTLWRDHVGVWMQVWMQMTVLKNHLQEQHGVPHVALCRKQKYSWLTPTYETHNHMLCCDV